MTSLNHEEVESIVALQAIGAATPEEERSIQEHLAGCTECRQMRDEYLESASRLALALDPVTPPAEVRAKVFSSVGSDEEPTLVGVGPRSRISPWWLATAATLFLALWGWREFGIRVARERLETQEAEVRRLTEENARLAERSDQL